MISELSTKEKVTHRHFGNAQTHFFYGKLALVPIEFFLQVMCDTNEKMIFEFISMIFKNTQFLFNVYNDTYFSTQKHFHQNKTVQFDSESA